MVACAYLRPLPSFPAKLPVGIFWLWFQELDAAGMLSGMLKNKSACASSDERGRRILRGSDRSGEFGLTPNSFGQIV
jgi:hypothetical protein